MLQISDDSDEREMKVIPISVRLMYEEGKNYVYLEENVTLI